MTTKVVPALRRSANQKRWLEAFAEVGTQAQACDIAGVGLRTLYDWLSADQDGFKALRDEAYERFTDGLERTMWNRLATPVGNRGSDILLMFALKARRPDVYRELTVVLDGKAVESMEEVKKLVSQARKRQRVEEREKPEVSVQEQADEVVRKRVVK